MALRVALNRRPERFAGRHEVDGNLGDESLQPLRAFLHTPFLGHVVTEDDKSLFLAIGDRIPSVFDRVPLSRLAADQNIDIRTGEISLYQRQAGRSGVKGGLAHQRLRIADNADTANLQAVADVFGKGSQGSLRKRVKPRVIRNLKLIPSQCNGHAGDNPIRLSAVPVIVESP